LKETPSALVHKVDITAFDAAGKQNTICVLYQLQKLVTAALYYGIEGVLLIAYPFVLIPVIPQV
jgi:hypothetical protein